MKQHLIGHMSKNWGFPIAACGYTDGKSFTGFKNSRFGYLGSKSNGVDCKKCLRLVEWYLEDRICCLDKTCRVRLGGKNWVKK